MRLPVILALLCASVEAVKPNHHHVEDIQTVTITKTITEPGSCEPTQAPQPPAPESFVDEDIEKWLQAQVPYSEKNVLANIHPQGTQPGVVVAATSRTNPPYFFHWIREYVL